VRRIVSERRREMGRGIMSVTESVNVKRREEMVKETVIVNVILRDCVIVTVTVIVGKGSEVVAVKGIVEDETGNAIMSVIVRERGKEIMVTGLTHGIGNERGN
jgi:hypothetical protein